MLKNLNAMPMVSHDVRFRVISQILAHEVDTQNKLAIQVHKLSLAHNIDNENAAGC